MTTVQVLEDFTRDELRQLIYVHTGRSISVSQFYEWLPFALIPEPKALYTKRDARKLMFLSSQLNRVRSLETAKQKLIEYMQSHPQEFEL
jgi:hypothetical protein